MGRKRKNEPPCVKEKVQVVLTTALLSRLDREVIERQTTRSQVLRDALIARFGTDAEASAADRSVISDEAAAINT